VFFVDILNIVKSTRIIMCGEHNMHRIREIHGKSLLENLKSRCHFEDKVIDGRLILK